MGRRAPSYLEQIIAYRLPPGKMVTKLRATTNKEQRIGFYFYDPRHKSTTLHKNHISNLNYFAKRRRSDLTKFFSRCHNLEHYSYHEFNGTNLTLVFTLLYTYTNDI